MLPALLIQAKSGLVNKCPTGTVLCKCILTDDSKPLPQLSESQIPGLYHL